MSDIGHGSLEEQADLPNVVTLSQVGDRQLDITVADGDADVAASDEIEVVARISLRDDLLIRRETQKLGVGSQRRADVRGQTREEVDSGQMGVERTFDVEAVDHLAERIDVVLQAAQHRRGNDDAPHLADGNDIGGVRVARERADLSEDVPRWQERLNAGTASPRENPRARSCRRAD